MAEYGSDHYVSFNYTTGVSVELTRTQRASSLYLAPTLASGAPLLYKRAELIVPTVTDFADNDILALCDMASGDRIHEMFVSINAGFVATQTANLGLYEAGDGAVGTVIEEDLFTSAVDIGTATTDRVSQFLEAGNLTDEDRGRPLWALAALGAASYTEDPHIDMTIAYTLASEEIATAAVAQILLEVFYVAAR